MYVNPGYLVGELVGYRQWEQNTSLTHAAMGLEEIGEGFQS